MLSSLQRALIMAGGRAAGRAYDRLHPETSSANEGGLPFWFWFLIGSIAFPALTISSIGNGSGWGLLGFLIGITGSLFCVPVALVLVIFGVVMLVTTILGVFNR